MRGGKVDSRQASAPPDPRRRPDLCRERPPPPPFQAPPPAPPNRQQPDSVQLRHRPGSDALLMAGACGAARRLGAGGPRRWRARQSGRVGAWVGGRWGGDGMSLRRLAVVGPSSVAGIARQRGPHAIAGGPIRVAAEDRPARFPSGFRGRHDRLQRRPRPSRRWRRAVCVSRGLLRPRPSRRWPSCASSRVAPPSAPTARRPPASGPGCWPGPD